MAERFIRKVAIDQYRLPLTNAQLAQKGELALLNPATGKLVIGAVATGLIPIGFYAQSGTGDGTTKFDVQFFEMLNAYWFKNDTTDAVTAAMVGGPAYVFNGSTVSSDATGTSIAGLILEVSATDGVLVAPEFAAAITTALGLVPA